MKAGGQNGSLEKAFAIAAGHYQQGRLKEAEGALLEIQNQQADIPDVLHLLALIALKIDRAGEAVDYLEKAIAKGPPSADLFILLGSALKNAGRMADAVPVYKKAISLAPDMAETHYNLANTLKDLDRAEESIPSYQKAMALDKGFADAHYNLGLALKTLKRFDGAVAAFGEAARLNPKDAEAHMGLGAVLAKQDDTGGAIEAYTRVVALKPDMAEAHNNLGVAYKKQGDMKRAMEHFELALEHQPEFAEAFCNLGNALNKTGDLEGAIEKMRRAIELDPEYASAFTNLGDAQSKLGLFDDAVASHRQAIAIDPDHADAHRNLSMVLLLLGQLGEGFAEYEWRTRSDDFLSLSGDIDGPPWDGRNPGGKTILLRPEQGFGDAIQFIRYAPAIAQLGGKVMVMCPPPLAALFEAAPGVAGVIIRTDQPVSFDVQALIPSLPHIFGTEIETIPAAVPYLQVPGGASMPLEETGEKTGKLKVGIAWAGSPVHKNDNNRSMDLGFFEPLLGVEGCVFYSLQVGDRCRDIGLKRMDEALIDLGKDLSSFAHTAAAVDQLDLVISVDTAVVHLAGALAKPVWTLLPWVPDWRWLLDRDDSPWYPTMRLFRQQAAGDWPGVIQAVVAALRRRLDGGEPDGEPEG